MNVLLYLKKAQIFPQTNFYPNLSANIVRAFAHFIIRWLLDPLSMICVL